MARLAVLAALVLTLAATGCGGPAERAALPRVDVALDFAPNAVHAPVYAAVRRGLDRANGVELRVRRPGQGPDSLKLVASGRVALGLLDIGDLALARRRGIDVVAVGALVDRPLAALIAQPEIERPRDLEGETVGVSGLPSDPAFVRAIMAHDGGDARKTRQVTIGFSAVSVLLTRRVAAVPAFWNAEGVALRRRGRAVREFRVDDYGAPAYPELVLTVTRETLQDRASTVRAAVAALARGYEEVLADPENGVSALVGAVNNLDRAQVERELDAVLPSFTAGARAFGELDRSRLEAWARWEKRFGITKREPEVGRAFDGRYVPAPGRD